MIRLFVFAILCFGIIVSQVPKTKNDLKIFNGRPANPNEVPYAVTIAKCAPNEVCDFTNQGICGASLIDPNWVLTAAHCFEANTPANTIQVSLGRNDLSNTAVGITAKVSSITLHPNYDLQAKFAHDVALLRLATPITIPSDGSIKVIPLYSGPDLDLGTVVVASGWGGTASVQWSTILNTVNLKIQDKNECGLSSSDTQIRVCAAEVNADTCRGDSGGSLSVIQNGVSYLYGITSYGGSLVCGQTPLWGVYAKVSAHRDWIAATQNGQPWSPPPPPSSARSVIFSLGLILTLVISWIL